MRRLQQLVNQQLVGVGPDVFEKRFHRRRLRRKTDQVEMGSANEHVAVGIGREAQSLFFQLGQQELVDRLPHAILVANLRFSPLARRLKGPVATVLVGHLGMRRQGHNLLVSRRAGLDPTAQQTQFRARDSFLVIGRHLPLSHQVDQQAAVRFAANDRRAVLAAPQNLGESSQIEFRFPHVAAVAVVAL